jgi:hypothetical protein
MFIKLKIDYKTEKRMKKLYGKLNSYNISFGRKLIKLIKNEYSKPERLNEKTSKEDAIV